MTSGTETLLKAFVYEVGDCVVNVAPGDSNVAGVLFLPKSWQTFAQFSLILGNIRLATTNILSEKQIYLAQTRGKGQEYVGNLYF